MVVTSVFGRFLVLSVSYGGVCNVALSSIVKAFL